MSPGTPRGKCGGHGDTGTRGQRCLSRDPAGRAASPRCPIPILPSVPASSEPHGSGAGGEAAPELFPSLAEAPVPAAAPGAAAAAAESPRCERLLPDGACSQEPRTGERGQPGGLCRSRGVPVGAPEMLQAPSSPKVWGFGGTRVPGIRVCSCSAWSPALCGI